MWCRRSCLMTGHIAGCSGLHTPAPIPSPSPSPTPALAVRRATRRQYLSNCHSLWHLRLINTSNGASASASAGCLVPCALCWPAVGSCCCSFLAARRQLSLLLLPHAARSRLPSALPRWHGQIKAKASENWRNSDFSISVAISRRHFNELPLLPSLSLFRFPPESGRLKGAASVGARLDALLLYNAPLSQEIRLRNCSRLWVDKLLNYSNVGRLVGFISGINNKYTEICIINKFGMSVVAQLIHKHLLPLLSS